MRLVTGTRVGGPLVRMACVVLLLASHLCLDFPRAVRSAPAAAAGPTGSRLAAELQGLRDALTPAPGTLLFEQQQRLFKAILEIAIAIDKMNQWVGKPSAEALKILAGRPDEERWFRATGRMLRGQFDAAALFFQGQPPPAGAWNAGAATLRRHGYPAQANAFLLLGCAAGQFDPGAVVAARAGLTPAQRTPLETLVEKYAGRDRLEQLVLKALQQFAYPHLRPPARPGEPAVDAKEYFAVALRFAPGCGERVFPGVGALAGLSKREEAAQIARALAAGRPDDARVQRCAAAFLAYTRDPGAAACYQAAIRLTPDPESRDARLEYLSYLLRARNTAEAAAGQSSPDPVAAGDAYLMAGKYPEAADLYRPPVSEAGLPLEKRLAAWAGLLDAEPAAALARGPALADEVGKAEDATRARLAAWMAGQLWRAVSHALPVCSRMGGSWWQRPFRPLVEAPEWASGSVALTERLLAADAAACLRPYSGKSPESLRGPFALLCALAGQPEKALETLQRRVQWEVPAVKEGGPTHTATAPDLGGVLGPMPGVLDSAAACPDAARNTPPLAVLCVNYAAGALPGARQNVEREAIARTFAGAVRATAEALDPRPAPDRVKGRTPGDPAAFGPVGAAVREALKGEAGAGAVPVFLREGVQPALIAATNPQLLDALTALALDALDRHAAVAGAEKARAEAASLAGALEARKAPDMKPYAVRLRERFPG